MAATQKINSDPGFLFTPSDSFLLGRTVSPQYNTKRHRRQTDDSTVGQKYTRKISN